MTSPNQPGPHIGPGWFYASRYGKSYLMHQEMRRLLSEGRQIICIDTEGFFMVRDNTIAKYDVNIELKIIPKNQYGDVLPNQTSLTINTTYVARSLTGLARLLEHLEKLPKDGSE